MRDVFRCVFWAGLIAGTIDIGAAALINGVGPGVILRVIASGLLGAPALQGDNGVAALGLILQWVMSWMIAALFAFAATRLSWLTRRWVLAGIAYGAVIYAVMTWVVMPLSAVPFKPHFRLVSFIEDLLAMVLFGLIVAATCRRIRVAGG